VDTVLLANLAATLVMTRVIWFVQLVHYPLFALVGPGGAVAYEREHTRRTTWVVAPAMGVEALTAVVLALRPPDGVPAWLAWAALGLVGVAWLSTWLVQVPCHRALSRGPDPAVARRLVRTNWVRTAAWSLRAAAVLWMVATTAG
jgi:hypothetical protein